jgi:hypothetical protein
MHVHALYKAEIDKKNGPVRDRPLWNRLTSYFQRRLSPSQNPVEEAERSSSDGL